MKAMYDIVTIGSTTRDAFLKADVPVVDDPRSAGGRAIHVGLGEKLELADLCITPGGNSANAATTFARQGFRAACFAEVGDDGAAREIEAALRESGVTPLFRRDARGQTAFSAILLTASGERTIFAYHGANHAWESPPPVEIFAAPWWYVSLSGETSRHFPALMEQARARRVSVALNPSGYHIRHHKDEMLALLQDIAFLVLNQEEAALLLGMDWREEREVFRRLDELVSPGIVALSYGPKGSAVSDGRTLVRAGIFPERAIVDRTGAGDAFGSGFVAGLMRRKASIAEMATEDLQYAVRLGSANATSVVEHLGATPGILTREQFESDERWKELRMEVDVL